MAFSKIILTFSNWDVGDWMGTTCNFRINGVEKNETAVAIRTSPTQFQGDSVNNIVALNFLQAWTADHATNQFTVTRSSNVVTITAKFDGIVFSDFATSPVGRITHTIDNVIIAPVFNLTSTLTEPAAFAQCTTVKVTLTQVDGTAPFTWVNPLTGLVGLVADNFPRLGGIHTVTIEDSLGATDTIDVDVPSQLDNTALLSVSIEGDPSGLHGTVGVLMAPRYGVVYEYSMDDTTYQTSNVFNGILPGVYTIWIRDQWGCKIADIFTVNLAAIRPPVYRLIPRSNSFGWHELQAAIDECHNPYNGSNAKPNNYKPTRFYNPKYFQPWCNSDVIRSQFRSNYDTLTAELVKVVDDSHVKDFSIYQVSNNIGQRQIMDARIYDRTEGQTGVYWMSGNIYNAAGDVVSTYTLDGQLPEWARVGQKFTISGSAADGLFEIRQVIFDSVLLVNAVVIDRIYTDVAEVTTVKVDATYNRLNYETYEFISFLDDVSEGCYKIKLSMTDSLEEYPDSLWETHPFVISPSTRDMVVIESSDHVDDGIFYATGIIHKQRFQGVFYEEDYPSNYETSRDSRKALQKLDGRVQKVFYLDVVDIPYWVYEKLALYISKKQIAVNGLPIQIEEPFEVERNKTYSRVNLHCECFVVGYEQYMTNAYDIL